jgi:hypothetical protein
VPLPTDPEALAMAAGSMVAAMDELRRRSIAAAEDLEALAWPRELDDPDRKGR